MNSIEERLAQDIEAVTRGVVVTDSELREAWTAVDDRIVRGTEQDRRRPASVAAAAAVLALVLGLATYLTIGDDGQKAAPAGPGPSPSADANADFLAGEAPTSESLRGVWRLDDGGLMLRFAPPDLVTWDRRGRLLEDPIVQGRYAIDGNLITIDVGGGPAGCGGQQISMRASVPEAGSLHLLHTDSGRGACNTTTDERWVLEQALPTSPLLGEYNNNDASDWRPIQADTTLQGTWLAEGGRHLLELAPSGVYNVVGGMGEQVDHGEWAVQGERLTFTSGRESATCDAGDRMVLGGMDVSYTGTQWIRGSVEENTCGGSWTPNRWLLIPNEGS